SPAVTSPGSVAGFAKRATSRAGLLVLGLLIVLGLAGWYLRHRANVKWATAQLPKIEQLAQAQAYFEAYNAALAAQKYLPEDPTIARLMPTISQTISVKTDPAGAAVYLKRYAPDSREDIPRTLAGTTPLNDLRIARGQYILSVEKSGYASTECSISGTI